MAQKLHRIWDDQRLKVKVDFHGLMITPTEVPSQGLKEGDGDNFSRNETAQMEEVKLVSLFFPFFSEGQFLQGGPLQVINRVITPINGLING